MYLVAFVMFKLRTKASSNLFFLFNTEMSDAQETLKMASKRKASAQLDVVVDKQPGGNETLSEGGGVLAWIACWRTR